MEALNAAVRRWPLLDWEGPVFASREGKTSIRRLIEKPGSG